MAWHPLSSLSQATSGTPVSQERRGLLDYNVLDKNQNLICHSENIPPRTFRTLDFDLEKRY